MLEKKDLYRLKKQLLLERKKLEKELANGQLEFGESLTGSIRELSAYDNHPADLGSETYERGKDLGLQDARRVRYEKINEALESIGQGKYGNCVVCGQAIPFARLEILPYTRTCVHCQALLEKKAPGKNTRPVEERILVEHLTAPGGDDPGIDREDIRQEVYKYGAAESPQDLGGEESYNELYTNEPRGVAAKVENEQVE